MLNVNVFKYIFCVNKLMLQFRSIQTQEILNQCLPSYSKTMVKAY